MSWKIAAAAAVGLVVVGCQSTPADFKPDPKLKTASISALKSKVAAACVITQRARASLATPVLQKSCGCYADRTLKEMTPAELAFYRESGYFSDSARAKGEAALNSCGLKS